MASQPSARTGGDPALPALASPAQDLARTRLPRKLALAATVGWGVAAGLAWALQDRLLFKPPPAIPRLLPPILKPLQITSAPGVRLHGWLRQGQDERPAPTFLYFGGNAEEVSLMAQYGLWPDGWNVLTLNYRGYGDSTGAPGELALVNDALAIYDHALRLPGIDPARVVAVGRSLGSGVAVKLAAARPLAGVVLATPYDSMRRVAKRHYPWLPVRLLLRHRFESLAHASRIRTPALFVIAGQDDVIPARHARTLYDAWGGAKAWAEVPEADHRSVVMHLGFWTALRDFAAARA